MVRSSFTAPVEYIFFLRLLSRDNDTVSNGIQQVVESASQGVDGAADIMAQAERIVSKARKALGEGATQKEIYDWAWSRWDEVK